MNEEKKALRVEVTVTEPGGASVGREPCPWGAVSDAFARQYCLPVKTDISFRCVVISVDCAVKTKSGD